MVVVENSLTDLSTSCEPIWINAQLNRGRPDVNSLEQAIGSEKKKCSVIF